MRTIAMTAAAVAILGLAACGPGPAEEAGEAADSAYEQSTTGTTDLGQGPAEETGEAIISREYSAKNAMGGTISGKYRCVVNAADGNLVSLTTEDAFGAHTVY